MNKDDLIKLTRDELEDGFISLYRAIVRHKDKWEKGRRKVKVVKPGRPLVDKDDPKSGVIVQAGFGVSSMNEELWAVLKEIS